MIKDFGFLAVVKMLLSNDKIPGYRKLPLLKVPKKSYYTNFTTNHPKLPHKYTSLLAYTSQLPPIEPFQVLYCVDSLWVLVRPDDTPFPQEGKQRSTDLCEKVRG